MWQIINVEPADGECSICRSHKCGVVDGKHQWIMSDALDDLGEPITICIGYNCVKLFAENLGINKEVVEKTVYVPPTDYEILQAIKKELELKFNESIPVPVHDNNHNHIADSEHHEEPQTKNHTRSKTKASK